jgi:hypothetical protein
MTDIFGASDVVSQPVVRFGQVTVMDAAVVVIRREMCIDAGDAIG